MSKIYRFSLVCIFLTVCFFYTLSVFAAPTTPEPINDNVVIIENCAPTMPEPINDC